MKVVKFYEAIKDITDLVLKGEKFVCLDGERLYPEKASPSSCYLSKSIVDKYGFYDFFKECTPFYAHILKYLLDGKGNDIRRMKKELSKLEDDLELAKRDRRLLEEALNSVPLNL